MSDQEDSPQEERKPRGGQRRSQGNEPEELASKTLRIQGKRFYLDARQNWRGRMIKITEVSTKGIRNSLFIPMPASAVEFRNKLSEFCKFYEEIDPNGPPAADGDSDRLKSDTMRRDNWRYYLDLKENQRGLFLKVAQVNQMRGERNQIAIPVEGMKPIEQAMNELFEEVGCDEDAVADSNAENLPESQSMRVQNRLFYFDVGSNPRGQFMRVTQSNISSQMRSSITIPQKSWAKFRDILTDFVNFVDEERNDSGIPDEGEN